MVLHKIKKLIEQVPLDTLEVKRQLAKNGISQGKLHRWTHNPTATIGFVDQMILLKYFRKFKETGVSQIEHLYETSKTTNAN